MLDILKKYKLKISITLLIAFYVSGLIGILTNSSTIDFLSLTPLNLIVNMVLLLANHQFGKRNLLLIFFSIGLLGFFIELLGVNTGIIFGEYTYGETLGWKFFETPLIIGVNWIMLTYAVVYTIGNRIINNVVKALVCAAILVALDFLIEPVAIAYDFWSWENEVIPLKNYIAWFCISFVFCFAIAKYKNESKNDLAPFLLLFQFIFFGIFNFVLWK
ncbi:carotenoid biosynthesis protein [Flavobacterium lacus]|uniref:Putative membrane protein n=1 Tax=Flavobacterium lacus TaxID=1353778 RepID=A0A328WSJ8_9FLAO|nr:carotenoid biosynthesis protein [Flavobacterium lacus]RAR48116.1 putative membrane protein [Flavobacterium lacus]